MDFHPTEGLYCQPFSPPPLPRPEPISTGGRIVTCLVTEQCYFVLRVSSKRLRGYMRMYETLLVTP